MAFLEGQVLRCAHLKQKKAAAARAATALVEVGVPDGIRTHARAFAHIGFRDRCLRPLGHGDFV